MAIQPRAPANWPDLHLHPHLWERESDWVSPASGLTPPGSKVHSVLVSYGQEAGVSGTQGLPTPGLRTEQTP